MSTCVHDGDGFADIVGVADFVGPGVDVALRVGNVVGRGATGVRIDVATADGEGVADGLGAVTRDTVGLGVCAVAVVRGVA
ncbi:MAG: hypothetical protein JWM93_3319 [Frankiales bacterium]|nr:hypothetical protein [Frankiales bacterium]